jgi:hypothetical protein
MCGSLGFKITVASVGVEPEARIALFASASGMAEVVVLLCWGVQ